MTLSARFSVLHSDLNDFLFVSVGDQQNEMLPSVISALTGLGVDPWEKAAWLAALPKVLATETLAPMIGRLSIRRPQRSDNVAIAQRFGGASANTAEPGQCAGQEILQALMFLTCFAFWGGSILRHVVIGLRPGSRSGPLLQCTGIARGVMPTGTADPVLLTRERP
jgi:hypothetical protein